MEFSKEAQSSRIVYLNEKPKKAREANRDNKAILNGLLLIKRSGKDSGFSERVRIGVSLRAISKPRPTKEWNQIVHHKSPISTQRRGFQIDDNYWFGKGITWVIPTPLFETTTIQINLDSSALLSTGFIIEIFRRDSTIVHEVKPSTAFTVGCSIKFKVNWNLSTNPVRAAPILTPAQWARTQPSESGSQPSIASVSSFQSHDVEISSDDD